MYNHTQIEKKWQDFWEANKTFKTENDFSKPKYYCLDMFPYPSWAWLHVWHPEWMTANDIVARYKKAKWYNVLHPMGWDAFWLPAENYAIKTWVHPKLTTKANIDNFRKQIKSLWFSYDWDREVDTTDPEYYKWTQWIFLKMFETGLAYEQDLPINYCPSCKTGLANEEVLNDFSCERCGTKVEKKKIRQWVLAITKYADRLEKDVDKLDWPEGIKDMQKNWIWRSEGCEFEMKVAENKQTQKKWESLTSVMDGHDVLARFSSASSIFENMYIVKKKVKFSWKIEWKLELEDKIINFNSVNIFKHFKEKNKYEFLKRKELLVTVFKNLENLYFESEFIWYFILKKTVIKVVLWQQSNWNYFIKSYYEYEKYTKIYLEYLKNNWLRNLSISVYTTRIDTVFGMTYAVLAPDHKDVIDFITEEQKEVCLKYIENAKSKSDQDRTNNKEKTWVFTGTYLINPFNNEKVPLYIWDYVLGNYGTWAVMAVPAHDERDFEFAKKYGLEIKPVIFPISYHDMILKQLDKNISNDELNIISKKILEFDNTFCKVHAFTEDGILENILSYNENPWFPDIFYDIFQCPSSVEARKSLTEFTEKKWFWKKKVNYKLRDWLFSRQRYWGEPIPLIHLDKADLKTLPKISSLEEAIDKNLAYMIIREPEEWEEDATYICPNDWFVKELVIEGKIFSKLYEWLYGKIVCDYRLPLTLPEVDDFEPSWDWNSPLAKLPDFINVKLADNLTGKRETNTMPQWGWSCWYYLRYMDSKNDGKLVDRSVANYWWEVDSYVGWAEHAVLHLLYARFWHKFLFDIWVVPTDEPFYKLRNQGLILAYSYQDKNWKLIANDLVEEKDSKYFDIETGGELEKVVAKMSKSLKNVVNPDDIISEYGADTLRLYEMYISDFKDSAPWDTKNIIWVRRFIEKSERLFDENPKLSSEDDIFTERLLHKTIKKVSEDIEVYKFNTAIASLMILVNNWLPKDSKLQALWKYNFTIVLSTFSPHLAEELWERLWNKQSVFFASWPEFDEALTIDDTIKIAVQVAWKLRWVIEITKDEEQAEVIEKAKANEEVAKWLEGKQIIKEIYVPRKIVNLIVK